MMRIAIACFVFLILGCARVNLQTEKPLKVDISMRVDVYQHVAKDVASIEDQIHGGKQEQKLNSLFTVVNAYAQDYSGEVAAAIERRKERTSRIEEYVNKGYVGENKDALLTVMSQNCPAELRGDIAALVQAENGDRNIIYQSTAEKNGADIASVRKAFFDDHYKRAASGAWFEIYDSASGYRWAQK
jgi:uncharacterized protein YdbL (DUF1318 family)